MMRRRTIRVLAAVILVMTAIVIILVLRKRAAPEPARLLPEANAYVYVDLKPLRVLGVIGGKATPAVHEPEYEDFVRATGFDFERDLDEAAFAIHSPPRLADIGPEPPDNFRRYSEIFRGHFDARRVSAYLQKAAKSVENYRDVEIYSIPLEGRTARVALPGVGIAAVSNTEGVDAVHFMIDRYKETARPFGGPALIRQYYRRVPFGSLLWGMAALVPGSDAGKEQGAPLPLPGGFDLYFPSNTVVVGSVRYTTAIQVRLEAFAGDVDQAKYIAEQVNTFLGIFHTLENSFNPGGADPDAKKFFESVAVQQYKARAILTATASPAFLKKVFAEPGEQPRPEPSPAAKPAPKKLRKGR